MLLLTVYSFFRALNRITPESKIMSHITINTGAFASSNLY